jgi:hypothetical protein
MNTKFWTKFIKFLIKFKILFFEKDFHLVCDNFSVLVLWNRKLLKRDNEEDEEKVLRENQEKLLIFILTIACT